MNIGVLASHTGTTLQAVLDACQSGALPARVSVVIGNNSKAMALERARAAGIATHHLSSKTHPSGEALDQAITQALEAANVEVVLLAGYMKRLGPITLARYRHRILNTHPALLPSFGGAGMYGERVHRAVLDAAVPITGATVHLVESEYDTGPTVAQVSVPVRSDDTVETLAARVQENERQLVISVLTQLARGERKLPALG